MLRFIGNSKDVVAFVEELPEVLKIDWQLITVMRQGKYAACSVRIAIDTSLADIVRVTALAFSLKPLNT